MLLNDSEQENDITRCLLQKHYLDSNVENGLEKEIKGREMCKGAIALFQAKYTIEIQ